MVVLESVVASMWHVTDTSQGAASAEVAQSNRRTAITDQRTLPIGLFSYAWLIRPVRYCVLADAKEMERLRDADGRIIPRKSFRCGCSDDVAPVHRTGKRLVGA